jgi:AcrR family transcriptional regulator
LSLGQTLPAPPDWTGGSLLNLMASVARASGARDCPHAPVPWLDMDRLAAARTLVLLVVDGLGDAWLRAVCPRGALTGARAGVLDSLVPSTTASVITTVMTGAAPATHGLVGWFLEDETLGGTLCPLPATRRVGTALTETACASLYAAPSLWSALARTCHVLEPRELIGSAYTRHHATGARLHGYDDLPGMCAQIVALARPAGAPRIVYAYWPELDRIGHALGIGSAAARAHLAKLDAQIGGLAERLAGTSAALLVTGDHGFEDVPPGQVLDLAEAPGIGAALRAPLSGEPRFAYAHLRAEAVADFPARVVQAWGGRVAAWPSAELVAAGHFGPGVRHPRLAARCGDYVLVPEPGYQLRQRLPGERAVVPIGVHGGLTANERRVPLACFAGAPT